MDESVYVQPRIPISKLAEYMVTANSSRRTKIVRGQLIQALDPSDERRWWYQEAKAEIRKFIRNPSADRQSLLDAALGLRGQAALEAKESRKTDLLASASALEAFAPIAKQVRDKKVVVSAGTRKGASITCRKVKIVVSPDLLLLDRTTEALVGAVKLHASRTHKLNTDALQHAASILYSYLKKREGQPVKSLCMAVDLFVPAYQHTPAHLKKRLQEEQDACTQIAALWHQMYEDVLVEVRRRSH